MRRRTNSCSATLLRLILPAIIVVGGVGDTKDQSSRLPVVDRRDDRNNNLRRRHEQLQEGANMIQSDDSPNLALTEDADSNNIHVQTPFASFQEDYIDLTLPISVVIRNRALKKDKNDKDKNKSQSFEDPYAEILAKYKALGAAKAKAAAAAQTQTQAQATTVTVSANPALQQKQQQPPQQKGNDKQQDKKKQPTQKGQQQSTTAGTTGNTGGGGTIVSHNNGVLQISAGTIDLRGVAGSPSTTPRQQTCTEVKPLLGCDRGGGENQLMKFMNVNFGTCKTCDRGLFKVMPTKMAYYCPEQGRPACGGTCHSVSADGKIRDKEGGAWGGYWPANFGCPLCM